MAISKVQTQQVSTPRPAAPAKPKAPAAPAAQTAAAGWSAGANKASSLKITHAALDEGPKMLKTVALPKGYTAELKSLEQKESDTVHGTQVTLEQSSTQLNISGPGGKKFSIGDNAKTFKETAKEWRSEVDAAKKAPKEEFMQLGWDNGASVTGLGTAGKLFSVSESGSSYTGGAHPNNFSGVATYDATTGKQVKLDSLLSPKQMNELVNDVDARLKKMQGPDDIGSEAFGAGDKPRLRELINSNFALTTDKSGKVKIDLAWDSGIHALGGVMAHITLEAPTDAAFKKAAGLE